MSIRTIVLCMILLFGNMAIATDVMFVLEEIPNANGDAVVSNVGTYKLAGPLADIALDYVAGTAGQTSADVGIADTAGDGSWNYYESDDLVLTNSNLLVFGTAGGTGTDAYCGGDHSYNLPAISDSKLFNDGETPGVGELALHPGGLGLAPTDELNYLVLRWTVGAMSAGPINISGSIRNLVVSSTGDSIDFHVLVNSVEKFSVTAPADILLLTPFSITETVTVGDTVDFILGQNVANLYADESVLQATIEKSIPKAILISPENNSNIVLPVTQLKWTPAEGASDQYVYMATGTESLALIATLTGDANSVNPVPPLLALDMDYSWRVDSKVEGETFTGDTWSFHTRTALHRDINNDGVINLEDFAAFCFQWMQTDCYDNAFCGGADFNLSNSVGIDDLALLAEDWFERSITLGSLLNEMVDRGRLAAFPEIPYLQHQASSYDRRSVTPGTPDWFANYDWEHYIRQEVNEGRQEWVVMEDSGPGCITRIWIGGRIYSHGTMRFYVDGASSPLWQGKPYKIIGLNSSVGSPLSSLTSEQAVLDGNERTGANLYMPIPYNTSIKVTYDVGPPANPADTSKGLWYNINYRNYQAGENVKSFSDHSVSEFALMIEQVNIQLLSASSASLPQKQQFNSNDEISSGEHVELAISGAGAICRLTLDLSASDMNAALQETKLEIRFDDQLTVNSVPVGMFFGTGKQINAVKDWYRTVDSQTHQMNAYWVMPYQQSANIRVVNTGSQSVNVSLGVEVGQYSWENNTMYFHADYRQEGIMTVASLGPDWNYVHILGKGVYVGDTLMVTKSFSGWWGEGDEKIWVDGESFPSHFGTGTEDYYGYAWGHTELFLQPFIGQPQSGANATAGTTVNSRVRTLDAIPFNSSLKLDMEAWNKYGGLVEYDVAVFWYGMPGATLAFP